MYTICVMDHITKDDLAQLDRSYLQSLEKETVIDVACKLRDFSITLVERLEQNSSNSSKPPSSDNPYAKGKKGNSDSKDDDAKSSSAEERKIRLQKRMLRLKVHSLMIPSGSLEGSLDLKGSGVLRLR